MEEVFSLAIPDLFTPRIAPSRLHERTDDPPPSPAQLLHWLPSMSPYIMSHMHLASLLLTHLSNTTHSGKLSMNLTSFVLETTSPVVPWVTYYKLTVFSRPTRHYGRLAFITTLANTASPRDPCHSCNTSRRVHYIH